MNFAKNTLRKAMLIAFSGAALTGISTQASAIGVTSLGAVDAPGSVLTQTGVGPKRAFSDYGTNFNYGWTHTAKFVSFQVGSAADIASGNRFDVTVDLRQNGGTAPMLFPGFSVWTSGTSPVVGGAADGAGYGHEWSQVRGPRDGGALGAPGVGTNGWLGADGGGNILAGHDGWVGYANAGYSFKNGDGDTVGGLYAGASAMGTPVANVNTSSPWVNGGFASLASGDAMLSLFGLKAGHYLIGFAGACPDDNANGQNCALGQAQAYKLTISNVAVSSVPVPAAVWLFGSALAGMGAVGRRNRQAAGA